MAETPIPPGCENVKININFMEEVLIECNAKSINKVFIMSNSSLSSKVDALEKMLVENGKQVTKNYDIKMGGLGFEGACKAAAEFGAEVVVSIGTGAIQDCAKIVRIWIVWNGVVFKIRTFCVLMGMYNEVVLCLQYYSLYL